jgi:hypothetical protein
MSVTLWVSTFLALVMSPFWVFFPWLAVLPIVGWAASRSSALHRRERTAARVLLLLAIASGCLWVYLHFANPLSFD